MSRPLIHGIAFVAGCGLLAFSLYHFGVSLRLAAIAEAEGNTWTAYHVKEAERWKAIQANIELESKRTTVQTEIRRIVIAEWKKCRKGKC